MYRPRKIRVGAANYSIFYARFDDPRNYNQMHGSCDGLTREIVVYTTDSENETLNTFLHECMHAIYKERFLGADTNEELTVNGFTNGLLCLFKDNPKLLDWMKETL